MKKTIYFDHNATTPIRDSIKNFLMEVYNHTGNTSSIHRCGSFMKKELEESRSFLADLLKIAPGQITWTSGATESNNTVIRGYQGPIIISSIEHSSIREMQEVRSDLIVCDVDKNGVIDLDMLETLLKNHANALVCIVSANNEIGVLQPLDKIIPLVHQYNSFIFSDCVQAIGKVDIPYHALDGFSMSGHKIGTPYGIGILCLKPEVKVDPLMIGGGQERFKRAGTVNVYGAMAFAKAVEETFKETWEPVKELRDYLESELKKICPEIIIVSEKAPRLQNTTGMVTPGILNSTQMMHYDLDGFCVSSGSACSSGTIKTAHILNVLQYPQELTSCFIRVSLGKENTKEEINKFLISTKKLHERRKYS